MTTRDADPIVTIAGRFAGPPRTGNGGYTAGRLAARLRAGREPVTVTLRKPPPLDTALTVKTTPGQARLLDGEVLVADAEPGSFAAAAVPWVDLALAESSQAAYGGLQDHPFATCFVCGTARAVGDGLRLSPGIIAPGRTACVWTPDASLRDPDDVGRAAAEFVWSALDCPGGWTSDLVARPLVLGRMTAIVDALPVIGAPHVVVGALRAVEGRKTTTSTTLYDDRGAQIGRAEQVWIAIDPAMFARNSRA